MIDSRKSASVTPAEALRYLSLCVPSDLPVYIYSQHIVFPSLLFAQSINSSLHPFSNCRRIIDLMASFNRFVNKSDPLSCFLLLHPLPSDPLYRILLAGFFREGILGCPFVHKGLICTFIANLFIQRFHYMHTATLDSCFQKMLTFVPG